MFFKRNIPLIICFITGITFALTTYSPSKLFKEIHVQGSNSYTIMQALALLFGCVYIFIHHAKKIIKNQKGSGFSIILIISFLFMLFTGLMSKGRGYDNSGNMYAFGWAFKYIYSPLQATMFSLLGFFIASAAFRAFKIKNFISLILFLSVTVVIIGRIPFIANFVDGLTSGFLNPLSFYVEWLMKNPTMAAQRAILIGIAFGIIVTSIKTILGIDKSWLGKE